MTDKNPKVYLLFSVCACLNKALQMVSAMVAAAPLPEYIFARIAPNRNMGSIVPVIVPKRVKYTVTRDSVNGSPARDCRCKRCNDYVHIKHTQGDQDGESDQYSDITHRFSPFLCSLQSFILKAAYVPY